MKKVELLSLNEGADSVLMEPSSRYQDKSSWQT